MLDGVAHPVQVYSILLEIGIMCLILFLVGLLARKINLSLVPIYIITGLALSHFVRPSLIMEFMSTIGLILLLFLIGLEFNLESFLNNRRKILTGGVYDLVLNLPVGLVIGLLWGFDLFHSLFLAGIVYISSSAIIAKGIVELKRSANPETECLLGILVFEDLFIIVYLAILSSTTTRGNAGFMPVVWAIFKALGFFASLIIIARVCRQYIEMVLDIESTELFVLLIFAIVILAAISAHALGLSMALGAFLTGLVVSETNQKSRVLEVIAPFQYLTVAIFFVSFGLTSPITNFKEVYPFALLLVAVSIPTKLLTGHLAGKGYGLSKRARWRLGLSLLPRGEFSIVLATLAKGVSKTAPVDAITALYVLIIAVLGSMAMKYADALYRLVEKKEVKKPP